MIETDLRELDGWIAEKFMGYTKIPNSNPLAWVKPEGGIVTWEPTSYDGPFQPTRLPAAFALVKREVERRGWGWTCYRPKGKMLYMFEVSLDELTDMAVNAETEELAGCLAVKAAVEGSNG